MSLQRFVQEDIIWRTKTNIRPAELEPTFNKEQSFNNRVWRIKIKKIQFEELKINTETVEINKEQKSVEIKQRTKFEESEKEYSLKNQNKGQSLENINKELNPDNQKRKDTALSLKKRTQFKNKIWRFWKKEPSWYEQATSK